MTKMNSDRKKIALLMPFFGGSHRQWAEGWQTHSRHDIHLFTLPDRHWKWRMHGAAITLARQLLSAGFLPDVIVTTDMLDVTVLSSLLRQSFPTTPIILYMHENQLTYPWSHTDPDTTLQRDRHYAFINYTSALAADSVWFNSHFHQKSFLSALPDFLRAFPDHQEMDTVTAIQRKSTVMPLGLHLQAMDKLTSEPVDRPNRAVLLWNHRWEYDKNPDDWYRWLVQLRQRGLEFKLVILGEQYGQYPPVFDQMQTTFAEDILHFGYVESRDEYYRWLYRADILPVTSHHDFFGVSVVEAMYANVIPVLPKRLAYPEHIPAAYHTAFFYENEKEGLNFLHRQIMNVRLLRKQRTDHFVDRYDWRHISPRYDAAIDELT